MENPPGRAPGNARHRAPPHGKPADAGGASPAPKPAGGASPAPKPARTPHALLAAMATALARLRSGDKTRPWLTLAIRAQLALENNNQELAARELAPSGLDALAEAMDLVQGCAEAHIAAMGQNPGTEAAKLAFLAGLGPLSDMAALFAGQEHHASTYRLLCAMIADFHAAADNFVPRPPA